LLSGIQNAVIIYNPKAGRGLGRRVRDLNEAQKILRDAGVGADLQATTAPGAASELARQAVAQGRQLVIVCGGDGTINEVVNGLACSRVPMAVLPAGTANVLGKELGLPWDIRAAAKLIPQGRLERIALGAAIPAGPPQAQRYFIAQAGAGADGKLVYAVKLETKLRLGILAYWLEGFRQAMRYPFPEFRVISEGATRDATTVVVGRVKHYGGPVRITTGANLLEAGFEVLIFCPQNWKWLRHMLAFTAALLGQHRKLKECRFWKTTAVRCEPVGSERLYAQVDGEPFGALPIEFRIVPDALTLVVPATWPEFQY